MLLFPLLFVHCSVISIFVQTEVWEPHDVFTDVAAFNPQAVGWPLLNWWISTTEGYPQLVDIHTTLVQMATCTSSMIGRPVGEYPQTLQMVICVGSRNVQTAS